MRHGLTYKEAEARELNAIMNTSRYLSERTPGGWGQMTRQALCVSQIRQRAHLQPIGSPSMIGVKIEASGRVDSQLVVIRKAKRLI